MAEVGLATDHQEPGGPSGPPGHNRRGRRNGVPGGRAVVGGFLVAAAAVGLFATYSDITAGPHSSYVAVAADLPAGHELTAEDLRLIPLDLPPPLAATAFADSAALEGATLLVSRGAGELLQRSDVVRRDAGGRMRELSFAVEATRAVGGRLRPGEIVDVVATYGTGDGASTAVVVAGVQLLRLSPIGGSLVGEGRVELTVALADGADVLALVHAVNVGHLTVVRATGADGNLPASYRPARPSASRGEGAPPPSGGSGN